LGNTSPRFHANYGVGDVKESFALSSAERMGATYGKDAGWSAGRPSKRPKRQWSQYGPVWSSAPPDANASVSIQRPRVSAALSAPVPGP
jgi:hypothetical protein